MDPNSATADAQFEQAHFCESALFSGKVVAPTVQ